MWCQFGNPIIKKVIKNYGPTCQLLLPHPSLFAVGGRGGDRRTGGDCGRDVRVTGVGGRVHGGDARDGAVQEANSSKEGRHRRSSLSPLLLFRLTPQCGGGGGPGGEGGDLDEEGRGGVGQTAGPGGASSLERKFSITRGTSSAFAAGHPIRHRPPRRAKPQPLATRAICASTANLQNELCLNRSLTGRAPPPPPATRSASSARQASSASAARYPSMLRLCRRSPVPSPLLCGQSPPPAGCTSDLRLKPPPCGQSPSLWLVT